MFASQVTKSVSVQSGDESGSVTIRKLSHVSLEKAREEKQAAAARAARLYGGDLMKALRETSSKPDDADAKPTPEQARLSMHAQYDPMTVLRSGIASWTFAQKLPAALEDLDEDAVELLHHAILDLSGIVPKEEAEAALSKG